MHVVVKSIGKPQFPYDHDAIAKWCNSHTLMCHILERRALSGLKRRVINSLKSSESIRVQSHVE